MMHGSASRSVGPSAGAHELLTLRTPLMAFSRVSRRTGVLRKHCVKSSIIWNSSRVFVPLTTLLKINNKTKTT